VRPLRPPNEAALEQFWRIDRRNWLGRIKPLFNVAPITQVPILVRAHDGAIELIGARWGLIPAWWKDDKAPSLTFNARSEEAAGKPDGRGDRLCRAVVRLGAAGRVAYSGVFMTIRTAVICSNCL
jgi:putative SOS response-associated peptidase YedK